MMKIATAALTATLAMLVAGPAAAFNDAQIAHISLYRRLRGYRLEPNWRCRRRPTLGSANSPGTWFATRPR